MTIFFRCFGILGIIGLEFYALSKGVNGIGLSLAIGAICGLCGFEIAKILDTIKHNKERFLK